MLKKLIAMRRKHGLRKGVRREFALWKNRYLAPTTTASIRRTLLDLGVGTGDLVMVHSAFSRIGYVRGGTTALLAALREVVGPDGTLVMPSFPFNDPAVEYAKRGEVFDVRSTPARIGQLQEDFRRSTGTIRSLHPTHPYCANGPLATWLLAGHHLRLNPFGPETPLYRFVERGGKCLLLGVGLKNCSPFRAIEAPDSYPHPIFEANTYRFTVIDECGHALEVETLVHSGALAMERQNEVFREPLVARGKLVEGTLGLAACILVDCTGLLEMMAEMVERGQTPYSSEAPPTR